MFHITKIFRFEAAHILSGACTAACVETIHGHSYRVEVRLGARGLDGNGMVMDFGELKEIVRPFIEGWDHALLVQKGALSAAQIKSLHSFNRKLHVLLWNPTAECMAYTIATGCKWPKRIVEVEVKVWETDSSFASYRSEDDLRCAVGLEPLAKGSHP